MTDPDPTADRPPMDDERRAYLALLSAVVGRMSTAGWVIKGWGITLLAGLFVISRPGARVEIGVVLTVALLVLYRLDARVFGMERIFRARYETVRSGDADVDFAMEPSLFDAETYARSPADSDFLTWFWGGLVVLALLGALILHLVVD